MEEVFRPSGITLVQYNVLRILLGAEPEGLCRNELRDRMLNRMPDVTRLLDRMEKAGLVRRSREDQDRRQVRTRITQQGRQIVDDLEKDVARAHSEQFSHMKGPQLAMLTELLDKAVRG